MCNGKNYIVLFTKDFDKELDKLSKVHKELVLSKVLILENNPFYPSLRTKKMKGNTGNYESSINMSIRIIWQFVNNKIIALLDVGHHDVLRKY